MFPSELWDQVSDCSSRAYWCCYSFQRRERMEIIISGVLALRIDRSFFPCWLFWLRFSAWASENAEHCLVLFCCVEAAGREAVQFGSDFILIE